MTVVKWKNRRDAFIEALSYLKNRQNGLITSIKTPWERFNDASTDGLEWNTTTVIGGRPSSGKTLIKDQIIREAFILNPLSKFRVLEFQFEMLGKTAVIREYVSLLNEGLVGPPKTYKYLCSADKSAGKLTAQDYEKCRLYAKEKLNSGEGKNCIDLVEDPCTVEEFKQIVSAYLESHSAINEKKEKVYTNTIVTLDHSLLLKKGPGEKDKFDTLYALGEAVTYLKRKYPIIFLILSQLNRDIDKPERNEDGKYGNFILESDIFGSDALLQHADILIGINRPGKQKIQLYGVDRFMIQDDTIMAMHFLKCRNGNPRLSFFKTEFEKMKIKEIEPPPKQERRRQI
jgi:hypothetical protein